MNITLKLPNPQQHARLFLDDVITRYKAKSMSAADYVLNLLNIYRAKGQKLNIPSAKAFYTQFGIAKSTFYRALNKLESISELGFHWEPTGGMALWCGDAEDTSTPLALVEKEEPTYPNYKIFKKQASASLGGDFEAFVRKEWRKFKGQEIISFYHFMKESTNFQNWWAKFQQYKAATATSTSTATATSTETQPYKRTFSPIPDSLKGLFGRKPT
jgi:hypothetical protein